MIVFLKEKMGVYGPLSSSLRRMLDLVAPSGSPEDILYHPCLVTLKDGRVIDRVYVQEAQTYIRSWGVWPEQGSGKWSLPIEAVAMTESSPTRLPARIATEIYKSGESGMGFNIFTLIFADGQRQAYSFGNAVDFVIYPRGKGPNDVVAVLPHEGRNEPEIIGPPHYHWCLYSEA